MNAVAAKRLELDIEISVLEWNLKRLKPRSALRVACERQLKAARLARMMLDINWRGVAAA